MIIVRLSGGLGNQLFQFATGKALAIRHGRPLIIDDRVFQEDTFRSFCLSRFNAQYTLASERGEIAAILPPARKRWLSFLLWQWGAGRRIKFIRERSLEYDPSILQAGPDTYLHGYWQSEQYFQHITEVIKQELSFRDPPSAENQSWLREIAAGNAVSIHVRRGDYVADAKANRVHGTCSLDYYRTAAAEIARQVDLPLTFYAFSDDPQWVAEHLQLPFQTRYVRHNDDAHNYEDLRLMSSCHHHIVANSSFSWWGAWLGQNQQRIVIAPRTWFNDPTRSDRSLVPQRWIRL